MKIKEVIEKTGLTDRAIRLYIDEGLIAPSIGESYSGRKSIEFSQEDIERLKNVAMLRKAGFTIADIKSIVDDKSTIKEIVEKFIEQTEENIAHETEIVEKLKAVSAKICTNRICGNIAVYFYRMLLPVICEYIIFREEKLAKGCTFYRYREGIRLLLVVDRVLMLTDRVQLKQILLFYHFLCKSDLLGISQFVDNNKSICVKVELHNRHLNSGIRIMILE